MARISPCRTQESLPFLFGLLAVTSAIFFPTINLPGQSMMNVCIYSEDPSRYQPKCFLCPSASYGEVLRACVSATAIPRNISYSQASCIEQNCAVGRGKRDVNVLELFADEEEDYED